MKILVITSCTGEKKWKRPDQLTREDFEGTKKDFRNREVQLLPYRLPAQEMYTGQQHVRCMRGIEAANEHRVKLHIVSAGYGLVKGTTRVVPYELTFQGMKKGDLRAWATQLGIPTSFRQIVRQRYDLGLILLGGSYLDACAISEDIKFGGPTIFFCNKPMAKIISKIDKAIPISLNATHAKKLSCPLIALKGEMCHRLLSKTDLTLKTLKSKKLTLDKKRARFVGKKFDLPKKKNSAKPKSIMKKLFP